MTNTYYPDGQGNQIDWNTNIINNATLLPTLGFTRLSSRASWTIAR